MPHKSKARHKSNYVLTFLGIQPGRITRTGCKTSHKLHLMLTSLPVYKFGQKWVSLREVLQQQTWWRETRRCWCRHPRPRVSPWSTWRGFVKSLLCEALQINMSNYKLIRQWSRPKKKLTLVKYSERVWEGHNSGSSENIWTRRKHECSLVCFASPLLHWFIT